MKIIFSHGKESGPWGTKIKALADIAKSRGHGVHSIDYSDLADPSSRVERLLSALNQEDEGFCLVGSSMGGYISLVAAERTNPKGVFLLAPALYMTGYEKQEYRTDLEHIEIIHGWSDNVIPPEHSIQYAKNADCTLHLISGDHRLNSSLDKIKSIFNQFLSIVEKIEDEKLASSIATPATDIS